MWTDRVTFDIRIILLCFCVSAVSSLNIKSSLNHILRGNCRVVSPRVCKKISGFVPDYSCGFIIRHICGKAGSTTSDWLQNDRNLHITPLSNRMSFYDINSDNVISLIEFARTLGHDPRELHVKVAFHAADKNDNLSNLWANYTGSKSESTKSDTPQLNGNIDITETLLMAGLKQTEKKGDGLVERYEFLNNNVWVFEGMRKFTQFWKGGLEKSKRRFPNSARNNSIFYYKSKIEDKAPTRSLKPNKHRQYQTVRQSNQQVINAESSEEIDDSNETNEEDESREERLDSEETSEEDDDSYVWASMEEEDDDGTNEQESNEDNSWEREDDSQESVEQESSENNSWEREDNSHESEEQANGSDQHSGESRESKYPGLESKETEGSDEMGSEEKSSEERDSEEKGSETSGSEESSSQYMKGGRQQRKGSSYDSSSEERYFEGSEEDTDSSKRNSKDASYENEYGSEEEDEMFKEVDSYEDKESEENKNGYTEATLESKPAKDTQKDLPPEVLPFLQK